MRIAFVGKGGSGKSTISSSFALYLLNKTKKPIIVVDADLNINAPELLGLGTIPPKKHLSFPKTMTIIKKWLIGKNSIPDIGAFRKTTPPTTKSNIIRINDLKNTPLYNFGLHKKNLSVFAVGTYQESDIGASCYHNNLSMFENILNHLDDKNGYLVADMVAGVDSFAGTLHAQFDITCFIIEPTKRSIEVFKNYEKLSKKAGVFEKIVAIGNKVRNNDDKKFILKSIPNINILGMFLDDDHIREVDKKEDKINFKKLNILNQKIINLLFEKLDSLPDSRNERLNKIHQLHKKYIGQEFIKNRYGNLSNQIDKNFKFE